MRALISVSDKTGIVELANELEKLQFEIVSTGGTAKTLRQAEISTQEVSDLTGFPEILGGRVKTLHPKIFGGILYCRDNQNHKNDMENQSIQSIDWVIVNLYPFERIHMENKIPKAEMLEFIDIGGVSLLRAAAKNYSDVVVLCDNSDYNLVIQELILTQRVSLATRKNLASKAFMHTAHYDSMIAKYFRNGAGKDHNKEIQSPFPDELTLGMKKVLDLRYGENPQQKACLYRESGERNWGVVNAEKIQGKELSFNNYLDLDSAWQIVNSFNLPQSGQEGPGGLQVGQHGANGVCCVIIKHTNPCGTAIAANALDSFRLALSTDPLSAFGGIIGFSSTVDQQTAEQISKTFFECIIAPEYTQEALELFKTKPNLRVLRQSTILSLPYEFDMKKISGGLLVQQKDWEDTVLSRVKPGEEQKVVSKRAPTPEEIYSLNFAWNVCKYVKSNAIVLAQGTLTHGIGAGQMSRIDSLNIAMQKARTRVQQLQKNPTHTLPLVLASDAFFPFRDCVDEAAKFGVTAIMQPGGSLRDQESIDAANEHNVALIFTGIRHFRH